MKQIKIAIIGAGSAQFSAGLVRDLCLTPSLYGSKICLMDIDEARLGFISGMARKLAEELNSHFEFESTTDMRTALSNADFVINTAQDQGHSWYEAQREIGERHGYYRGGMLGQIYQTAFLLEVAQEVEKYCPDALLIQSSNPVFEGCTVIHRKTSVNAVGLCHGHYGYREIADVLGLERDRVTAKSCGFNHWIWMYDFRYDGKDAYPLLDSWIKHKSEEYWKKPRKYNDQQMSRAAIHEYQLFGLMPIGDTTRMLETPSMVGWFYNETLDSRKYWFSQQGGFDSELGWAEYLEDLHKNSMEIEQVARDSSRRVTEQFAPVHSDEQIVPIIHSIVTGAQAIYQVNIPNKGHLVEGFPEDIVVECEALISGKGIQGVHAGRLPSRVMAGAMNPRYTQCELVSEAICTGEWDAFRLIYLMDHATKSLKQVDDMLNEWVQDPRNRCIRKIIKR